MATSNTGKHEVIIGGIYYARVGPSTSTVVEVVAKIGVDKYLCRSAETGAMLPTPRSSGKLHDTPGPWGGDMAACLKRVEHARFAKQEQRAAFKRELQAKRLAQSQSRKASVAPKLPGKLQTTSSVKITTLSPEREGELRTLAELAQVSPQTLKLVTNLINAFASVMPPPSAPLDTPAAVAVSKN